MSIHVRAPLRRQLAQRARRVGHDAGVGAEELHADRALVRLERAGSRASPGCPRTSPSAETISVHDARRRPARAPAGGTASRSPRRAGRARTGSRSGRCRSSCASGARQARRGRATREARQRRRESRASAATSAKSRERPGRRCPRGGTTPAGRRARSPGRPRGRRSGPRARRPPAPSRSPARASGARAAPCSCRSDRSRVGAPGELRHHAARLEAQAVRGEGQVLQPRARQLVAT